MGLFKTIERRAAVGLTAPERWFNEIETFGGSTASGKRINSRTALQMSAVYFCVSLIADSIASLPTDTFKTGASFRKPVSKPHWLTQPNPVMTPFDFWHRVITSMLLEGNGYIWVVRNGTAIDEVWPIHPNRVSVHGPLTAPVYMVDGRPAPEGAIVHIPAFTQADHHEGLSVIDAAREAVGLGLTAEEFGTKFFAQGTTMAGVIESPVKLEPAEARRLKADFSKSNSGVKNSHAVGVLTGGAKWQSISVTPEQAQFLATRAYTKVDIALFFRVPPYMLDPAVTSSWGSGVEEQNWAFVQNTLQPWLTRIEQAISSQLLYGTTEMRFNLDARLRAKTADRYEAYTKALNNGFMCADDVRALEDMGPLPDGHGAAFWRPANLVEVGKEPPAPVAPVAPPTGDPAAPNSEGSKKSA